MRLVVGIRQYDFMSGLDEKKAFIENKEKTLKDKSNEALIIEESYYFARPLSLTLPYPGRADAFQSLRLRERPWPWAFRAWGLRRPRRLR